MLYLSVYEEARKAAAVHKWIESEKAGYDLGPGAVHDWTRSYWLTFYRYRFVQHLRGEILWAEFDERTFGVIGRSFITSDVLVNTILDQVKQGAENLTLINLSLDHCWPMESVISILRGLDINSQRLAPPSEGW